MEDIQSSAPHTGSVEISTSSKGEAVVKVKPYAADNTQESIEAAADLAVKLYIEKCQELEKEGFAVLQKVTEPSDDTGMTASAEETTKKLEEMTKKLSPEQAAKLAKELGIEDFDSVPPASDA